MNYSRYILIFFVVLLFSQRSGFAQLGISHEVGILAGPTAFFTDYGERWNVRNNLNDAGYGIGLVHYMNFAFKAECNCYATDNFFNDHFKIRTEIDYFYSKLEHSGPVSEKNNKNGRLLRAMHGSSQLLEIGAALEYYPLSIRDFTAFAWRFSPFISLGVHYSYYQPGAYSDLGPIEDPKNLFPTFRNGGVDMESGTTWVIAGSLGARYRLGISNDLHIEGRWHYYDSDWLDGLNIDAPQNKFKDYVFWFNVGYIYYLNY